MDLAAYHRRAFEAELDPTDPGHIEPPRIALGHRLLDVGCGAGQTLAAAYRQHDAYGVDVNVTALQLGRDLGCSKPLAGASSTALPFRNASFDAVIARASLPYTNVADSLREIRRVLRDGGLLWMVSHSFSIVWNGLNAARPKSWVLFGYAVVNGMLFNTSGVQFPLLGRYESFQTAGGIRRALKRAGFENIKTQDCVRAWNKKQQCRLLITTANASSRRRCD